MKAWMVALIGAVAAFFAGLAMAIEVVFLRMPKMPPGASFGWDPVSLFRHSGLQLVLFCACIAAVTFAIVYGHFSRHPLPRN